ncbi:MAG: helix-turn-helix domain-containing protein [Hassallia sp.]
MNENLHIGSSLDDFLEEEGILEEINLIAIKRVIAWQIKNAMEEKKLTKSEMAKQMKTSRSSLDRLLDPNNASVTLDTIDRAAKIIGKRVRFELVDAMSERQN